MRLGLRPALLGALSLCAISTSLLIAFAQEKDDLDAGAKLEVAESHITRLLVKFCHRARWYSGLWRGYLFREAYAWQTSRLSGGS